MASMNYFLNILYKNIKYIYFHTRFLSRLHKNMDLFRYNNLKLKVNLHYFFHYNISIKKKEHHRKPTIQYGRHIKRDLFNLVHLIQGILFMVITLSIVYRKYFVQLIQGLPCLLFKQGLYYPLYTGCTLSNLYRDRDYLVYCLNRGYIIHCIQDVLCPICTGTGTTLSIV